MTKLQRVRVNKLGVSASAPVRIPGLTAQLRVTMCHDGRILVGSGYSGHYEDTWEVRDGWRRLEYYGRYYDERGVLSLDIKRQPEADAWIDDEAYLALRKRYYQEP